MHRVCGLSERFYECEIYVNHILRLSQSPHLNLIKQQTVCHHHDTI